MTTINTLSEINFDTTLKVAKVRGGYAIVSGYNKLSKAFKTEELAQTELEKNGSFYAYWAKSASASIVNAYGAGLTKKIYI
jgi:hypothetical protein|nr:MAG TPA: hypothetical protein [Caudoviricetes sp.]